MHFSKKWKYVLLTICALLIVLTTALCSNKAFRYQTDSPDVSSAYGPASGETLTQTILGTSMRLSGVRIRFGLYGRVNTGTVTVELKEGSRTLCRASMDLSYLVENSYQEFAFNRPVNLKADHTYTVNVMEQYDGDNQVAVYLSDGGDILSSNETDVSGEMCMSLVGVYTGFQAAAVIASVLCVIVFCWLFLKLFGVEHLKVPALAAVTIVLIAVTEIASTDLFRYINTEAMVRPVTGSGVYQEIEPGKTWTTDVNGKYSRFDAVQLFTSDNPVTALDVQIVNSDTGDTYYDGPVSPQDLIYDSVNGNTISLSGSYPAGTYTISVKNIGDNPVSIAAVADDDGDSRAIDAALIKHTVMGYRIAFAITILLAVYAASVFLLNKRKPLSMPQFFLASAIPLGVIYLILFTPYNVPDAGSHIAAAYRLSNILLGHGVHTSWIIRQEDLAFLQNVFYDRNPSVRDYLGVVFNAHPFVQKPELVAWPNPQYRMEYYSILCYLPGVIGLTIGRILHFGVVPMIYLGRLATLVAYVAAGYYAVKRTPVGKAVFAFTALLPMCLMYSGTISYDAMVIISTLCFIACVLNTYQNPDDRKALIECCIWALAVGGVKGGGYLIFLPLAFVLISRDKKKSLKRVLAVLASGIVSVILFDVILPAGSSLFQFGTEASGRMAASYGFAHPLIYFDMVVRTFLNGADDLLINMGGTKLAQLESVIPAVVIVGMMLIAGIYSMFEQDSLTLKKKDKYIFLFCIFLGFYFTPIMLLSWTAVGSTSIGGLQGRYFMPALPLIFMVLTKFSLHKGTKPATGDSRTLIQNKCLTWFVLLSVLSVYYMVRLYLTR